MIKDQKKEIQTMNFTYKVVTYLCKKIQQNN